MTRRPAIRFCQALAILAAICQTLANPHAATALELSGVLAWRIPEGDVARVEVGGETVWPSIPYATNGLVAMWDGPWNAGLGRHDPATTNWLDLSGHGRNLAIGSTYAGWNWSRSGLSMPTGPWGRDFATCSSLLPSDVQAVETVLTIRRASSQIPLVWEWGEQRALWFDWRNNQLSVSGNSGKGVPGGTGPMLYCTALSATADPLFSATVYVEYSAATDAAKTQKIAWNGDSDLEEYGRADGWRPYGDSAFHLGYFLNTNWPFYGTLHAIRFYSRALTADEIAGHAAIDQIRFGFSP